jgi:hypothetical protein
MTNTMIILSIVMKINTYKYTRYYNTDTGIMKFQFVILASCITHTNFMAIRQFIYISSTVIVNSIHMRTIRLRVYCHRIG